MTNTETKQHEVCPLHSGFQEALNALRDSLVTLNTEKSEEHKDMWKAIDNRTPMRTFIWVIGGICAAAILIFCFQWTELKASSSKLTQVSETLIKLKTLIEKNNGD